MSKTTIILKMILDIARFQTSRVLIVKLGAVGDCVHTLYALRALRLKLPDAHIAWAVEEKSHEVVAGHPDLDQVLPIPRSKGIVHWMRSALKVGEIPFDLTIDFSNLFKSGLVTWFSKAPVKIGFDTWREANRLFTNRRFPFTKGHMVNRYFSLLAPLGITDIPDRVEIFVPDEKKKKVDDWFLKNIDPSRPVVALNPHGTWNSKLYPLTKYAFVANRLMEKNIQVVVCWGGKAEHERALFFKELIGNRGITAPATDLKELAHLLSKCTVYLGNDSGPMHMAAACGIGVVGLFGPTNPERVSPLTGHKRILVAENSCEKMPCDNRKCRHPFCMSAISENDVFEQTASLIEEIG